MVITLDEERIQLLKHYLEAPSPSGFEGPAQQIIREEFKKYCDKVETDVLGNVIGIRNPDGKPRIMITGHGDEIGFQVIHIGRKREDDGHIRFRPIGGIDPYVLPGQRVTIHGKKGPVRGVIGRTPIHELRHLKEEEAKEIKIQNLWIDIGARTRREAETIVSIGDPITYATGFERLLNDFIVSRAIDNKMGCFAVLETMRALSQMGSHKAGVYGVSTVQEELGMRGGQVSAYRIAPDVMLALTLTWDTTNPSIDEKWTGPAACGQGPILNRGANTNPVVFDILVKVAKENNIPIQIQGEPGNTGTDAWAVQVARTGVATAPIYIPMRYCHTPSEIISLMDLDYIVQLVTGFIERLDEDISFIPF